MSRKYEGFTLVELMIVVAIIGILAAIAIPNFVAMQFRAKRAEIPPNVDGIQTAELGYLAAYDRYVEQTTFWPDSSPSKTSRPWNGSASSFPTLGWSPNGDVRGSYMITTTSATDFTVQGISDVDGDSVQATYTATRSVNALMITEADVY